MSVLPCFVMLLVGFGGSGRSFALMWSPADWPSLSGPLSCVWGRLLPRGFGKPF
jgi:hypothetical protein